MKKRLLIALSILAIGIIGLVIFFYAAMATEKQKPVVVEVFLRLMHIIQTIHYFEPANK